MKKCFQALSAVLSVVLVGSAYGVSAFAEDSSSYNYSTFASESKDLTKKSVSARNIPSAGTNESPFDVFKIYKDHMEAEKAPYNIYRESWGIDVSEHQGYIDWVGVKNSGVDFAIIRAGYGHDISQIDDTFIQNMKGAQSVGLDVGTYWYSYAVDVEDAYREAETCYEIIKITIFNILFILTLKILCMRIIAQHRYLPLLMHSAHDFRKKAVMLAFTATQVS